MFISWYLNIIDIVLSFTKCCCLNVFLEESRNLTIHYLKWGVECQFEYHLYDSCHLEIYSRLINDYDINLTIQNWCSGHSVLNPAFTFSVFQTWHSFLLISLWTFSALKTLDSLLIPYICIYTINTMWNALCIFIICVLPLEHDAIELFCSI